VQKTRDKKTQYRQQKIDKYWLDVIAEAEITTKL
jgi:hypothetical protein